MLTVGLGLDLKCDLRDDNGDRICDRRAIDDCEFCGGEFCDEHMRTHGGGRCRARAEREYAGDQLRAQRRDEGE